MQTPLISIIVPCYNQAHYLYEALYSVLTQTYLYWECIIINDGSLDNTEEIARQFCGKDNRFKYVCKDNGGSSSARNLGIKNTLGQYITFIDADDWVDIDYLQNFLDVDVLDSKLIVQGAFREFSNGTKELCKDSFYLAGGCANLFERKIIVDNGLFFDTTMSLGEDTIFNLKYLKYVNGFVSSPKASYHYRENASSSVNNTSLDSFYRFYKSLGSIELEQYIKNDAILSLFVSQHKVEQMQGLILKFKEAMTGVDTIFLQDNPDILNILLSIFNYQNEEIVKMNHIINSIRSSYSYRLGKFLLRPVSFIRYKGNR